MLELHQPWVQLVGGFHHPTHSSQLTPEGVQGLSVLFQLWVEGLNLKVYLIG